MDDDFDLSLKYASGRRFVVKLANAILEMDRELTASQHEITRLMEFEQRYYEMQESSIQHNAHMLGGLLSLAVKPGVLEAIGKANEMEAAHGTHS